MARPPEPGATRDRYSGGAILFHWVIAVLIIGNILGALWTDDWEGPARGLVMGIHKATGITVLVLSLARFGWRLTHRPPPLPSQVGRLERLGARVTHWVFYGLMIAMPISGWLMISASSPRRPFTWYGLFDLPYLPVEGNRAVGGLSHDAHERLGYLLIALLALHVVGALKHHLRDSPGFLGRMGLGRPPAATR